MRRSTRTCSFIDQKTSLIWGDDSETGSSRTESVVSMLFTRKNNSPIIGFIIAFMTVYLVASPCRGFVPQLRILPRSSPTTRYTLLQAKKSKTTVSREGSFWKARMDGWRPTVNDVERISFGKPAKKKGTGSRGVPHRLNEEERFLFDQARQKGFLEVAGSGWRSQRREAPLLNTYRSLCDARGQSSIVLHKDSSGIDALVLDLSPLRYPDSFQEIASECLSQQPGGQVIFQDDDDDETEYDDQLTAETDNDNDEPSEWETRPIYQLPPFCIA